MQGAFVQVACDFKHNFFIVLGHYFLDYHYLLVHQLVPQTPNLDWADDEEDSWFLDAEEAELETGADHTYGHAGASNTLHCRVLSKMHMVGLAVHWSGMPKWMNGRVLQGAAPWCPPKHRVLSYAGQLFCMSCVVGRYLCPPKHL